MIEPSAITEVAVISSLGHSVEAMQARVLARSPGLSFDHRFKDHIRTPLGELEAFPAAPSQDPERRYVDVLSRLIDEIDSKSGLFSRYKPEEVGLFLGMSTYGVETFLARSDASMTLSDFSARLDSSSQPQRLLALLTQKYPIKALSLCFSNSCASAAVAIGEAHRVLHSGSFKAILVGGIDLLNIATVSGFDALQVLDHELCQPMTERAKGINLAEGAGLLLLESQAPLAKAWLKGYGACNEAYHPTKPDPSAKGMITAMSGAISSAGLTANHVAYVNAHGTGTLANDHAEQLACRTLFGGRTLYESTKAWHGHTLAASGALEGAFSIGVLQNLEEWAGRRGLAWSPGQRSCAVSNSFGFGGTFVSLLFDRELA